MNLARDSVTEFKQLSTPFEGISVRSGIWISAPFNSNLRLSLHSSHSLGYYFDSVLGMHTWCTLVGQLDEAEQEIFIKPFQICFDFSSAVCDKSGFLKLVSNLFHDSHNSIKDFHACTEKDERDFRSLCCPTNVRCWAESSPSYRCVCGKAFRSRSCADTSINIESSYGSWSGDKLRKTFQVLLFSSPSFSIGQQRLRRNRRKKSSR